MTSIKDIKKWKWVRVMILLLGACLIVSIIIFDRILLTLSDSFKSIVEMPRLFYIINAIAIFISILHLFFVPKGGIVKEHLLYKRLGPILSTPLTCLTFGTFIYCGLLIIYLVCYDDQTLMKYGKLDKTAVTFTMMGLMAYSVNGIALIITDICNPKEERVGKIVSQDDYKDKERE